MAPSATSARRTLDAAQVPPPAAPPHDGTQRNMLVEGPLLPVLVKLALPTVAVLFMTSVLSVAETYFVSELGIDAIAAASLVVPVMMLMIMVSNGGIGGGVSSAIARARGAGDQARAESLAWHAVVIGVVAGALFSLVILGAGGSLYALLGGSGKALQEAVRYSTILFSGAIVFWIPTLLQSSLRGAGNVKVPAAIILGSVFVGLVLSPILISGRLGVPAMGVAGAGVAQVVCAAGSLVAIVMYMRSPRTNLRLRPYPLRREHFAAILGVGLLSTLNAVMATVSISALTAATGLAGIAAIAGYGIASRLDSLLIPVMFGFGTAAITVIGTSLGAGNVARARQAALVNALFVAALLEVVGLTVALFPSIWMGHFSNDPAVLAVGGTYLRAVGPFYGLVAVTSELYFAGQGARRVGWPLVGGMVRFLAAVLAAWLVFQGLATLPQAFFIVAAGIVGAAVVSLYGFWRVQWTARK